MSHVSKADGNADFRQDGLDGIVERGLKSRHIQLIALGNLAKSSMYQQLFNVVNRWHNRDWTVHWFWWRVS